MIKEKRGNTSIVMPIMIVISVIIIITVGFCLFQIIIKFINYEKINTVALKYMFVIEKFGYLTYVEKEELINDLVNKGLKEENITIYAPQSPKQAGELIEFTIKYKDNIEVPKVINKNEDDKSIPIDIIVTKSTFSKK